MRETGRKTKVKHWYYIKAQKF